MRFFIEKSNGEFLTNGEYFKATEPDLRSGLVPAFDAQPITREQENISSLSDLAQIYREATGEDVMVVSEWQFGGLDDR